MATIKANYSHALRPVAVLLLILLSSCSYKRTALEDIASANQYELIEGELVKRQLAIDSMLVYPAFSDCAIDRVYSFPVGAEYGTLLLEFDANTIIHRQIIFCDRNAWLLPLPDTAKTSLGTRQVYENVLAFLNREFGASDASEGAEFSSTWPNGSKLVFDPVSRLVLLNLGASSHASPHWMVKPAGMPRFNIPIGLKYGDPLVTRESNPGFEDYFFGPDTMLGVPGIAYSAYDVHGRLQAHLWNSIVGLGPNVVDSFAKAYGKSLGEPTSHKPQSISWNLDSGLIRIVRLDSLTLYSIYVRNRSLLRSRETPNQPSTIELEEFTQLTWCSQVDEAAASFDPKTADRKRSYLYDRFVRPSLRLCKSVGETRPSNFESLWEN